MESELPRLHNSSAVSPWASFTNTIQWQGTRLNAESAYEIQLLDCTVANDGQTKLIYQVLEPLSATTLGNGYLETIQLQVLYHSVNCISLKILKHP